MATVELTKDNFEQVVTGNDVVIVDFCAPLCAPGAGPNRWRETRPPAHDGLAGEPAYCQAIAAFLHGLR